MEKKLIDRVKTEFKKVIKEFFRPLKSRWIWPVTIIATIIMEGYNEHELAKKRYCLFPERESVILQKYDKNMQGIYTQREIRELLIDYDLVKRDTPREIPELTMYRTGEPNSHNRANILK